MLQIIDDSSMGGAENHTRLITKEFARRGYRVILLCPEGPYVERFKELGRYGVMVLTSSLISKHYMNPLHGFDLIRLIKAIRLIRGLVQANNISVIHSHKHPADFLVSLSTVGMKRISNITTVHSMENKDKFLLWRWWRYFFIQKSLSRFKRIFAVSEYVRSNTIRYFSLLPEKVVTMMNGVDTTELVPDTTADETRRIFGLNPDHFVILCAGKLEYRKGQDILIRALSSIIRSGDAQRNITLLLAGNSNSRFEKSLRVLSTKLGIDEYVKWTGYIPNISNLLQIADLYVQPSRWDPLPRALIEAMAAGVPSIGSDVDGIAELIVHKKTGLLFNNEDAEDLAHKLRKSLFCPKLRKRWSEEAVKLVHKNHTISNMADTIEAYLPGEDLENRP